MLRRLPVVLATSMLLAGLLAPTGAIAITPTECDAQVNDTPSKLVACIQTDELWNHMEAFQKIEKRDPAEVIPAKLPEPIDFSSQRKYVRDTLRTQVDFRANGREIVTIENDSEASIAYRERMNRAGSPSERVAAGYHYRPGTELAPKPNGNGHAAKEVSP